MTKPFVEPLLVQNQLILNSLLDVAEVPAEKMRMDVSVTKVPNPCKVSDDAELVSVQTGLTVNVELKNEEDEDDIRLRVEVQGSVDASVPTASFQSLEKAQDYLEIHGVSVCYGFIKNHIGMLMSNSPFPGLLLPEIDAKAYLAAIAENGS